MPIRILIVSDHYPPFIGGAHRQTQLLAKKLNERGHEVKVATVWHDGFPEEADVAGIRIVRLKQIRTILTNTSHNHKQRHQPPFPDPITVLGLRKLINDFKPDIVHSYGWISYSCAVALLGKRVPFLISVRDYGYICATRTLIFANEKNCSGPELSKCLRCASRFYGFPNGWIATVGVWLGQKLLKQKISGVHSISAYVQQRMHLDFWHLKSSSSLSIPRKVSQIILQNFQESDHDELLDVDRNIQDCLTQLPAQPFILFVGALRRVKGISQLLEAYQQLLTPPPLVLIGTFEIDTPRDFPPGVIVLRDFPHRAVMRAWERSLFGVVPSLWPEPLGNVVFEGMSKGKAIIGTTPGGHTDMILDNETGILVPSGDVNALVAAMQRLIDDPELRRCLGNAALERSKMYTADMVMPALESFYSSLLMENK